MMRVALCISGLLASFAVLLGTPAASPRRAPIPPTYDCEPGRPDRATGTCDCPDGFEPGVHNSKVPFCRKVAPGRSRPAQLAATGDYHGPPGGSRGMQTARSCGELPESWVRARAQLDTRTGIVTVDLQLETRSLDAGPRGRASVEVRGASGELLATIESAEVGIGGKPPGQVAPPVYSAAIALRAVPARRATALVIRVACTGVVRQPYKDGGRPAPDLRLTAK